MELRASFAENFSQGGGQKCSWVESNFFGWGDYPLMGIPPSPNISQPWGHRPYFVDRGNNWVGTPHNIERLDCCQTTLGNTQYLDMLALGWVGIWSSPA